MPTTLTTRTGRARARNGAAHDPRNGGLGQSVAEFAMTVPLTLVMVLFGLDFGRVFLGWVTLNNAAREAANFAAMHPDANWGSPTDPDRIEYSRLVTADSTTIDCILPSPIPVPVFPNGTTIGSPAVATITCRFGLLTPIISNILGSPLNGNAASACPLRAGATTCVPVETGDPPPTTTPTQTPTPTSTPTAT